MDEERKNYLELLASMLDVNCFEENDVVDLCCYVMFDYMEDLTLEEGNFVLEHLKGQNVA